MIDEEDKPMPKIIFTPELSATIKALRIENNIPAKTVAEAIGHSPSYVSKLESYGIKSLEQEEFDKLLEVIMQNSSNINERREQLLSLCSIRYSKDELAEQLWFLNLDTVVRQLPIPNTLIEEINALLYQNNISISSLVTRINKNEELNFDNLKSRNVPVNEWFETKNDPEARYSIKMDLREHQVEQILAGEKASCNYVTMLAIVHYALKMIQHEDDYIWTPDELRNNWQETYELLDKHRFFSMERKAILRSKAHSKIEEENLLSEFDLKNQEIINAILKYLKIATELNVIKTNKVLEQFVQNLEWDFNFMLQLSSIKFDSIGECSFSNKNELLKEISAVVKKYREMPEDLKKAENYEFDI